MQIVLVGYMGSGKSTVGRVLANEIGLSFLDLDHFIEEKEGITIRELFGNGEIQFRKKEHLYLKQALEGNPNCVIATGGGVPCYSGNMDTILQATPHVVYLQVSVGELVERLNPEKKDRPIISHLAYGEMGEFIGKHLFERNPFYTKANYTVNCDGKSIGEIAGEIAANLF